MNIRTFVAKSAIWFSENEGGGAKAIWNFSENSSVLETPSVPKDHNDKKITTTRMVTMRKIQTMKGFSGGQGWGWQITRRNEEDEIKEDEGFFSQVSWSVSQGWGWQNNEENEIKEDEGVSHPGGRWAEPRKWWECDGCSSAWELGHLLKWGNICWF